MNLGGVPLLALGNAEWTYVIGALLLAVAVRSWLTSGSQRDAPPSVPRQPPAPPAAAETESAAGLSPSAQADALAALDRIRAADRVFNPETFLQRAEMTFFLVKRAYQQRDALAARPLLADGLFDAFRLDVDALVAAERRPLFRSLTVRGVHAPEAASAPEGDTIVVHFDVVSRDLLLDANSGAVLSDPGHESRYGERWTFTRKPGVKTIPSGGAVAQTCPACGVPLMLGPQGRCRACTATVGSGDYDWVVSTLVRGPFLGATSDDFFRAERLGPETGVTILRASDPAFTPEAFLALARRAFELLQTAWVQRDLEGARSFMSPGLYDAWRAQVESLTELRIRNVLAGLRVDAVDLVSIVHGRTFDDVTVRIDAACADYDVDERRNEVVSGDRTVRPFTDYWTFRRAVGVKTQANSLYDRRCPSCGATLAVDAQARCRNCRTVVNGGNADWVLARIQQAEDIRQPPAATPVA